MGGGLSRLESSRRLFSPTSGLPTTTPSPTPGGVPGQEIPAADSTDHSAAQQTDTTLCPNLEGAE